jgi:hypothetical protein
MFRDPITIAEAEEMGVPVCFTPEYAWYERHGLPLPCGGPVYPDNHPDPEYYDPDPHPDPEPCGQCDACQWTAENGALDEVTGHLSRPACTGPPPPPCQGPPPVFVFLGQLPAYRPHEAWCWGPHDEGTDDCPPPF